MISQVDSEVHYYQDFTEVTNHNRYGIAITMVNGFIKSSNLNLHRKRTTCGWKLLVKCKDESVDWFMIKDLK